jgi:hypothetical protein
MADLGITDSHLLDSRFLKTGGSAVLLGNAAGWQVRSYAPTAFRRAFARPQAHGPAGAR